MAHRMMLEVPQEVYDSLLVAAKKEGKSPEELALQRLAVAPQQENKPLPKFIGAFSSNIPDWVDRHDYYIGQALMESMRPDQDADSESG